MSQRPDEEPAVVPPPPAEEPAAPTVPYRKPRETDTSPAGGRGEPGAAAGEAMPSVPGYEVEAELGRGGMGVVYRARHLALKRTVALKMIRAGMAGGPERARFRAEAEAVARLQHPNIVQIHEVGEAGGVPFCALEFVAGGSLARRLAQAPPGPREAAALVEQLAGAMHLAHSRNVVHRDLKPGNVLLLPDGTPKVTDFGLARLLDADDGQTRAGDVMGTPSYMAPEQAAGRAHEVGPPADTYALGAILYECLTGRPPFRGASVGETLDQVRTREPVPPQLLRPSVPRDLATVCLKCLRKEPEARYASAQALADDLRRFREGRPVLARPVSTGERLLRWARREPLAAGLAASVLLVTLAGVCLVLWQWRLAEGRRDIAEKAQADAETAQGQLRASLAAEEAERVKSQRLAVRWALERGLELCGKGDTGHGLLWLARGLRLTDPLKPADRGDLEWVLRANLAAWRHEVPAPRAVRLVAEMGIPLISPCGRFALIPTLDLFSARLWDLRTLEPVGAPLEPGGRMSRWAFSPDGAALAASAHDDRTEAGEVRVWSTATGKLAGPPFRSPTYVGEVAAGPGGRTVACARKGGSVQLLDAATGRPVGEPMPHPGEGVNYVRFSPDGKRVLTGTFTAERLWDAQTGAPLHRLAPPPGGCQAEFSPAGAVWVRGQRQGRLYAAATLQPAGPPLDHDDQITASAFSPDGQFVLIGGRDGVARLWSAATGQPAGPPLRHEGSLSGVAVSPDGRTVATVTDSARVQLWSAATGQRIGGELYHPPSARVAFAPDGRTLASCCQGVLRVWPAAPPPRPQAALAHSHAVSVLAFRPDGRALLTGGWGFAAHLLSVRPDGDGPPAVSVLASPLQNAGQVTHAAFSADGRILLTGSSREVRSWSASTGRPSGPPLVLPGQGHLSALFAGADGRTAWTSDNRGNVPSVLQCWSLESGKPVGEPIPFPGPGRAVAQSPDGRFFLTGHRRGPARLWDAAARRPVGPPLAHEADSFLPALAFAPDGRLMATGSNREVRVWDVEGPHLSGEPLPHPRGVAALAFSPDGAVLLTQVNMDEVRLWSVPSRRPIGTPLRDRSGHLFYRGFSRDGNLVLTSCSGSSRLWAARTGHPVGPPLPGDKFPRAGAFSPDGRLIATGGDDRIVRLWRVPAPLEGDSAQVVRWAEVLTGMSLDVHDQLAVHDAEALRARRQELEASPSLPPGLRPQGRLIVP